MNYVAILVASVASFIVGALFAGVAALLGVLFLRASVQATALVRKPRQ